MTDLEKKEYHKIYYQKNKEIIKKRTIIYYINNAEKCKKYSKENYKKNKKKSQEYSIEYFKKNKKKLNKYQKEYNKKKRNENPIFKLTTNIRVLIQQQLKKQGYNKNSKTFQILGCSYKEFKQHIEQQFKKGMNWNNQGQWHLDHIYPVSLAKNKAELIKLNHYTNFQPLWAKDNITKGNKIIANTQIKLI
jgi:hypothetical protein